MDLLALFVALAAAAGTSWVNWASRVRFERLSTAQSRPYDDAAVRAALDLHAAKISEVIKSIGDVEDEQRDLRLAIAEGIERVDRSERRVRAVVTRAKKRLEEAGYADDGVDAEAESLRDGDAHPGYEQGVLPLHGGVEHVPPQPDMSAFPGRWD